MLRSPRLLMLLVVLAAAAPALLSPGAAGAVSAPVSPLPTPAGMVMSELDGLQAPVKVSCTDPNTATLTATGRMSRSRALKYTLSVDGRTVRTGTVRSRSGVVQAATSVPAAQRYHVTLTVGGRTVAGTPAGTAIDVVCTPDKLPPPLTPTVPLPVPTTGARGSASSYALNTNPNGTTTRWDPCAGPIRLRVNLSQAPAGAQADVTEALRLVSAASGLTFVVEGPTTYVPTTSTLHTAPAPMVLAWAAPGTGASQSDLLRSGALGVGGWITSGTFTPSGQSLWRIGKGFVVLDRTTTLAPGFGRGMTRGALLLHEIAHALGLNHVDDDTQIMYPLALPTSLASFGAGDLAGLEEVGARQGCVTPA